MNYQTLTKEELINIIEDLEKEKKVVSGLYCCGELLMGEEGVNDSIFFKCEKCGNCFNVVYTTEDIEETEEINEEQEAKADLTRKYDYGDLTGERQENFCN